jgi:hypothetical protein
VFCKPGKLEELIRLQKQNFMNILEICVFSKAYFIPTCAAMEPINNLQMQLNDGGFSTPVKKTTVPLSVIQMLLLIMFVCSSVGYR